MAEYKTGDTVALRSGGAVMTVLRHLVGKEAHIIGWPECVCCDWLDSAGNHQRKEFHPDQIERVIRVTDFKDSQKTHHWAFADMHSFPVYDTVLAIECDKHPEWMYGDKWSDAEAEAIKAAPSNAPVVINRLP